MCFKVGRFLGLMPKKKLAMLKGLNALVLKGVCINIDYHKFIGETPIEKIGESLIC
jgi:hypothetical protein